MPPLANGSSPSIPAAESGRPKKPENIKKIFKAQKSLKKPFQLYYTWTGSPELNPQGSLAYDTNISTSNQVPINYQFYCTVRWISVDVKPNCFNKSGLKVSSKTFDMSKFISLLVEREYCYRRLWRAIFVRRCWWTRGRPLWPPTWWQTCDAPSSRSSSFAPQRCVWKKLLSDFRQNYKRTSYQKFLNPTIEIFCLAEEATT